MSKSEVVASVNIESFIASKTSWEPGSGLVKLGSRSLDTLLTLVWRLLCFSLAVVYLPQRLWQGGEYSNFYCSNWRRNGTKQLPVNLSRRLWRQEIPKFLLCWRKTGSVTCGSAEQKLHRHQILMGIAMGVKWMIVHRSELFQALVLVKLHSRGASDQFWRIQQVFSSGVGKLQCLSLQQVNLMLNNPWISICAALTSPASSRRGSGARLWGWSRTGTGGRWPARGMWTSSSRTGSGTSPAGGQSSALSWTGTKMRPIWWWGQGIGDIST